MGHKQKHQHISFEKVFWQHRYTHGGLLRKRRNGRKSRPLSTKDPIHLVFKAERKNLKIGFRSQVGFRICHQVIRKFGSKFFVKIEQISICGDHIHLLVRLGKRSLGLNFFRVVAGQIAQIYKEGGYLVTDTQRLWKFRPFTRVVSGFKPYQIVRDYIQLNEMEARGNFSYKKNRLKGLSTAEWELLWS